MSVSTMLTRRRHRPPKTGVLALSLVLTVTAMAAGAPPAAATSTPNRGKQIWSPRPLPQQPSVPAAGGARGQTGAGAKQAPAYVPGPVAWPAAGTADYDLSAPAGQTGQLAAKGSASSQAAPAAPAAPVLPVQVTPHSTSSGSVTPAQLTGADAVTLHNTGTSASPSQLTGADGVGNTGISTGTTTGTTSTTTGSVRVALASHAAATAAGVTALVASVTRSDSASAALTADVAVDYSSFSNIGGSFTEGLQLVELPACALTTPTVPACRVQTPVKSVNDPAAKQLTATITLPGAMSSATSGAKAGAQTSATRVAAPAASPMMVLAATSTPSSPTGSYGATSLKPSDSWSVGNSGSFAYSLPITVPPALGGSAATLDLGYDSGSIDGKTSVSSAQSSWVGDGWDLAGDSSYIEFAPEPCSRVNPTAWAGVGDQCLGTANATLSLPGHAGDLVRDDATGVWRLSTDDGSRVEELTGAANGAVSGQYWRLTTSDGTEYYFGANRLPASLGGTGTDAATYSTWTEPMFGPGAVSGCTDPTTVTSTSGLSACMYAYRWNLDFVVAPGSAGAARPVTRYTYERELGYYAHTATLQASYVRSGAMIEADYGFLTTDVVAGRNPAAKIAFTAAPRCIAETAVDGQTLTSAAAATACQAVKLTYPSPGVVNSGISNSNFSYFADAPYVGFNCTGTGSCGQSSPSFWSTLRLASVTTSVLPTGGVKGTQPAGTPAGYQAVDQYVPHQYFPGTTTVPELFLAAWSHTGYTGNQVSGTYGTAAATQLPDVQIFGNPYANRSSTSQFHTTAPYTRMRVTQIVNELDGDVRVNYQQPFACGTTPPAVDSNHTTCFPEYWSQTPGATPAIDWFNKWIVTDVSTNDDTALNGSSSPSARSIATHYDYPTAPDWHSNDSEQTDPKYRTYDQFRGFGQVQTITGNNLGTGGTLYNSANSKTITTFFQGMDEDPTIAQMTAGQGGSPVCINDSHSQAPATTDCPTGFGYRDDNAEAGNTLETRTFVSADPNAAVYSDVISQPVDPRTVVTAAHTRANHLPVQRAHFMQTAKTITYTQVTTGLRRNEVDFTYGHTVPNFTTGAAGDNGRLLLSDDKGDTDGSGNPTHTVPERCTVPGYAARTATLNGNLQLEWTGYPSTTVDYDVPTGSTCTATPPAGAVVVSQSQTYYDGAASSATVNGPGLPTTTKAVSGYVAGAPTWVTTAITGYDGYGRVASETDADNNTVTTSYSPNTGALPTSTTVTGPAPFDFATTTASDPGRALPLSSTDANGTVTTEAFDGLGRLASVWTPGNPTSSSANDLFSYQLNGYGVGGGNQPSYTLSQTLREDGSYVSQYSIVDGLGRTVQTQSDTASGDPGRNVTDTVYDGLGRATRSYDQHYDPTTAASGTWAYYPESAITTRVDTGYDALSRQVSSSQVYDASVEWTSTTNYPGADEVDSTPPNGGTPSTVITDALGRTTADWTYNAAANGVTDGNPNHADIMTYDYSDTPAGPVSTVTDATKKNTWATTTDLLGRTTSQQNPDTGTTSSVYDNAGLLLQATDADNKTVSYQYDSLGRKTAEYGAASGGQAASNELASWAYDSLAKGRPTSSTRYTAGASGPAYISAVSGYDSAYRPTGTSVIIPSGDGNGNLAGTYQTNDYYTPTLGLLDHVDLPAVPNAGLASETVYYDYNENGLLLGVLGNADYLDSATYNSFGQSTSTTLGSYPYQTVTQTKYDPATQRVSAVTTDSAQGQSGSTLLSQGVDYLQYYYNQAGGITAVDDLQNAGTSTLTSDVQCYSYDYAQRLTAAWTDKPADLTPATGSNGPDPGDVGGCTTGTPSAAVTNNGPAPYWETIGYDNLTGNRTSLIDHDPTGATGATGKDITRNYTYPAAGTPQPHTLTGVTTSGAVTGTDTYHYDADGNTTTRAIAAGTDPVLPTGSAANQTLGYTADGSLKSVSDSVSGDNASYVYDTAGNELIRRDATTTTLYLGSTEVHLNNASGAITALRYYSVPNAPEIIGDQTGKLTYVVTNGQGTGQTTIDAATGQITGRRYYTPFNTPRGTGSGTGSSPTSWPDDHTFLNKSTDLTTGLVDDGARDYDPNTGRFVTADPIYQPDDAQAVGGYAYAGDDPASASDPSGLMVPRDCPDGDCSSSSSQSDSYVPTVEDPENCATELCYDELTQAGKDLSKQIAANNARADNCASESCYRELSAHYIVTDSGDVITPREGGGTVHYTPKAALAAMKAPPVTPDAQRKPASHCGFFSLCGLKKTVAKAAGALSLVNTYAGFLSPWIPELGVVAAFAGFASAACYALSGDFHDAELEAGTTALGVLTDGFSKQFGEAAEVGDDAAQVAEKSGPTVFKIGPAKAGGLDREFSIDNPYLQLAGDIRGVNYAGIGYKAAATGLKVTSYAEGYINPTYTLS